MVFSYLLPRCPRGDIKQQIEDDSCFPIEIIRQTDISDFKMLSYDQVPGYDPSEGITVKGPRMIHPEDHPNYPHYCYFGFEAEYDLWFEQTSNSKFKFKEHFPFCKKKICNYNNFLNCK